MARLSGKTAIIFGGGGRIGAAAANLFSDEGADVVIADLADRGVAVCEAIEKEGGRTLFVKTDVTAPDQVKAAIASTVQHFGKLNILYNCAGGSSPADGLIENVDDEDFWRTIRVDLYGTWLACKHGFPAIIASGGGGIVNMASLAGLRPNKGVNAYSAAKGGVVSLTRSLALGYGEKGVRVNAIAPGAVATPRVLAMIEKSESVRAQVIDQQHFGLIPPIEIAYMALYLASDEARATTGQIFLVDGGDILGS